MSQLCFGVMIQELCSNESSALNFQAAIGKVITALSLSDDALHFVFDDDSKLRLFDDGQSCCESRYMRTDDNLADYVGAKLLGVLTKPAPDIADEYGAHEVEFLEVETSKGSFVMSSHNEHNGNYGGFAIRAAVE